MICSNLAAKRSRPLLGTFFEIEGPRHLLDGGFELASRLEQELSKFNPRSWVSQFAGRAPAHLLPLLRLSMQLHEESNGAFDPWSGGAFDLSGIAKGWIVDRVAEYLSRGEGEALVNAGGDIRRIGGLPPVVGLRLSRGLGRMRLDRSALASSMLGSKHPSTVYHKNLRAGLNREDLVCTVADECAVADAFTKIILFGEDSVIETMTKKWRVDAMVFSADGALKEFWPSHEAVSAI